MTYIEVCWVTSILISIDEVKNSKIGLQRPWSFTLTLYLEFLAPFTYKMTPHMIHFVVFLVTSILTSNNKVMNWETDLHRHGTLNLKLDLDFLAPFTHKKTPHMTHILVFWVTSILTSIDEVKNSNDLQRPWSFILTLYLEFLTPFTYKKTPHMTYIEVWWVTSILTSIYEVIHSKIDIRRSWIFTKTKNLDSLDSLTYKDIKHATKKRK